MVGRVDQLGVTVVVKITVSVRWVGAGDGVTVIVLVSVTLTWRPSTVVVAGKVMISSLGVTVTRVSRVVLYYTPLEVSTVV
jgi:hypothetical protein